VSHVTRGAEVHLILPGDVLVISGVGEMGEDDTSLADLAETLREATGVASVLYFEQRVSIATIRGDGKS